MDVSRAGFVVPPNSKNKNKNKTENKRIGGFGFENTTLAECPTNDGIASEVADADSFQDGFDAILKAGIGGIALSVLQPLLDDLQDRFLATMLEKAAQEGKDSPCTTLEDVDVTYTRLFRNPNPEMLEEYKPLRAIPEMHLYEEDLYDPEEEKRVKKQNRDYKRHQKEPFAIARNLFSDIFDRRDPIGLLTDAEIQEIDRYWDSEGVGYESTRRYQIPIDALAKGGKPGMSCEDGVCTEVMLPPNKFKRIADARDAILARFKKPQIVTAYISVYFARGFRRAEETSPGKFSLYPEFTQTVPHFDDSVGTGHTTSPNTIKVTIPITETRATLMRSCNQEYQENSCTATLEEDLDNTPLLAPGDAQIFRPGMHMHAATKTRERGSMYFIFTGLAYAKTEKIIQDLTRGRAR